MTDRLKKQLEFSVEIDKMKTILRRTVLTDKSRRENDAEHSWHMSVMAMLLLEYAADRNDIQPVRVLKMTLIHDLVEIYAGDTFAFDDEGHLDKDAREQEAAQQLFGLLPQDQGTELRQLWEEFDAMESPDARYAASIDRLQPFLHNTVTDGFTWQEGHVTKEQVLRRIGIVQDAIPPLWPFVLDSIDKGIQRGHILP